MNKLKEFFKNIGYIIGAVIAFIVGIVVLGALSILFYLFAWLIVPGIFVAIILFVIIVSLINN